MVFHAGYSSTLAVRETSRAFNDGFLNWVDSTSATLTWWLQPKPSLCFPLFKFKPVYHFARISFAFHNWKVTLENIVLVQAASTLPGSQIATRSGTGKEKQSE